MDAALMGPLAAPPTPHAGESASAVAGSDAPGFAAALADADQTLNDTPVHDADHTAATDTATDATIDEAIEPSLLANDAVTLTQQCLADMAAMLASLNATPAPASAPVAAVAAALPETGTTDADTGPQFGLEAVVEDLLPERDRVVRLRDESTAPAKPSSVPDTSAAATADTADPAASVTLATGDEAAMAEQVAPSAATASNGTAASPPSTLPAIPPASLSASAPVGPSASPSQSPVAGATVALSAPAVSASSPGVQGVAARELGTRGRVASAAAVPTAATARAAAPSDPNGGDAGAATQHSQSAGTSTPPLQFSWLSAPVSTGVNANGTLPGARSSSDPAFHAQLSAQLFSAEFAPALGVQISTLTRNGIPEARLHLNPAELGPIAVQIELDGRTAQVVLSASHAETRLVLEQAIPQLASAMRDAGFSMSGGGVFQQPQQREPRAGEGTPQQSAGAGADNGLAPTTMTLARVQRGVVDVYA